ncbi:hypothetical protein D3C78_407870 [compost metagenome]
MTDEHLEHVLEVQGARLAVDQRHHVDAEHALHLGLRVEVVEHHLRHLAATQLDDHAHAVLVRLVAQLADALELLLLDQLGDLLDQARLVQLVGQLGDHQLLAAADLVDVLDLDAGAHVDASTAGAVGLDDAGATVDDPRGGEVRAGDVVHQLVDGQLGVVDQRQAAVDHLAQVVRRDVGGHAHGDAAGAVDQQVGDLGRHDRRDLLGAVVVGHPVDGFLVQVGEQLVGQLGHAHFGVAHGRGVVAVHRTEVALAVDQHVAQREWLGHAHDGVVHRGVAVRVVLTDDVTDHTGGFLVRLVPVVAQLAHGEQHAPVHRLQAVARIRQGTPDDHAHRVVEVRLFQLVFDIDRENFFGQFAHEKPGSFVLGRCQQSGIARNTGRPLRAF